MNFLSTLKRVFHDVRNSDSSSREKNPAPSHEESEKMVSDTLRDLDIVFVIDCTGSMGPYIVQVKKIVVRLIEAIEGQSFSPRVDFGLVSYRDHVDDFASRVFQQITKDRYVVRASVQKLSATGGGDRPEAVADGLHSAIALNWRKSSHKVIILIGDAPPHERCRCGMNHFTEAKKADAIGITVHAVACVSDIMPVFGEIASITGGEVFELSDAERLYDVILNLMRTEIRKMERDMAAYEAISGGAETSRELAGIIGANREETMESLARLEKKGFYKPLRWEDKPVEIATQAVRVEFEEDESLADEITILADDKVFALSKPKENSTDVDVVIEDEKNG